jgi:hypothetical protein
MPYQLYQTVTFGSSKAGLATVGYRLFDDNGNPAGDRVTAGVQDLGGGQYGANVTVPDDFTGRITWDTGEAVPAYASAGVNPEEGEVGNIVLARISQVTGSGPVPVNHDYGGPDNLSYTTAAGAGIVGATVLAYAAADYAAGRTGNAYVQGRTVTTTNGRWQFPLYLRPGNYTLVYVLPGVYGPNTGAVTVS